MVVLLEEILSAFPGIDIPKERQSISITGRGSLPSWFEVTDLAASSMASTGLMLSRFTDTPPSIRLQTTDNRIQIDQRLASFWFDMTLRPKAWKLAPAWDPIAGDYRAKDGWIRLHTNAPLHRAAALSVLGHYKDRATLEPVVARWNADDLETAIVQANGCAATMRSIEDWGQHPQGIAVSQEPLIIWETHGIAKRKACKLAQKRPLANIKVLDLTRILAGPVAGRFLAAYGADVLRIDPPAWEEAGIIPEVTLGKRCAGLNLKNPDDRQIFENLIVEADVLLHGYRPEALNNLGYDRETLRTINPSIIDVSLNAYGWSGPWSHRRGFDSLVQMSSGIADYGMHKSETYKPTPLPVQALDHATGYLLASAVLYALNEIKISGKALSARLSLARVAHLLCQSKRTTLSGGLQPETLADISPKIEETSWGPAHRIKFPLTLRNIPSSWNYPASDLRSSAPVWLK
ncbi:CoA transferase [Kiloniella antarctica]|uniref:CoA transferase n=1 Tax=Kiloniella antarctica TaxID=1550907 RepID=A0ABW5BF46_9PROT